jgi:HAAS
MNGEPLDCYLRELDGMLRATPRRRKRILAEVEEHLRDDGGDAAAIERFGSPAEVAARFNDLGPEPMPRLAASLVLGGALFVFAVVQGLEDALPPAPWPSAAEAPASLRVTFGAATVAILVGVAAALAALVLPRALRPIAAAVGCIGLGACVALLAANTVLRTGYVAGSPSPAVPIVLAVLALGPVAAGFVLLARPGLLRPLAERFGS